MCDTVAPFLITAIAKNSIDFSTAIIAAVTAAMVAAGAKNSTTMVAAAAAAAAAVTAASAAAAGAAAGAVLGADVVVGAAKYKSFCDLISTTLVDVVAKSNTIAAAAGYCKDDR